MENKKAKMKKRNILNLKSYTYMSSKNSTLFLVQLAVYEDVLLLLHGQAPDTIR